MKVLRRLQVPLYGDGENVRGWVHVDDHCRGIQLVLERGRRGDVYHINGNAELTNIQLTRALLDCCGADWEMVTREVSHRKPRPPPHPLTRSPPPSDEA